MPLLFCVFSGGWVSGFRHYHFMPFWQVTVLMGGLWGHFLGMCNVVYLLGGRQGMVAGEAIIISITGGFLFGLLMTSFHWWRRKVKRLPSWDDV